MTRVAAFIVAATLIAAPAFAGTYSAKPVAAPLPQIIGKDISWTCAGGSCRGSTEASRPLVLCQDLAKHAGRIESFTADGQALSAEQLAKCNTAAKGGDAPGWRRSIKLPEPRFTQRGPLTGPARLRGRPFFCACEIRLRPHIRAVLRQYELVEKVRAYDPDADEALINRAYVFSMKAHGAQVRASGDPYFSHPIEVAGILTDLKLDDETIVTAILHDTIEDTVATPEQIEKLFGPDVARLVDGVTKLRKIEAQTENERAAENLRKFLLALSDDIRVLLVKLADRLHNMRTLHHISRRKRRRIAKETMDIYAPLAERIGMYEIMNEMQGLAFEQLEPDAYASITRRLNSSTSRAATWSTGSASGFSSTSPTTASRPRSPAARSIPFRSGGRWPSGTSASSNCPT